MLLDASCFALSLSLSFSSVVFPFPFLFFFVNKKLPNKRRGSGEQRAVIVSFELGKSARFERVSD